MTVQEKIESVLKAKLNPKLVTVSDQSAAHAGHEEAKRSGGGHFTVIIVSDQFKGLKLIDRHRLIYEALKGIKKEIHALSIKALTPREF